MKWPASAKALTASAAVIVIDASRHGASIMVPEIAADVRSWNPNVRVVLWYVAELLGNPSPEAVQAEALLAQDGTIEAALFALDSLLADGSVEVDQIVIISNQAVMLMAASIAGMEFVWAADVH